MGAMHDVARYLLERVPHSTQDDHDQVAALIDQDEAGPAVPQDDNDDEKQEDTR